MKIIMNFIHRLLITFFCIIPALFAANKPLNIGVTRFIPPFVMQGANNEKYGFDVDMMISLCKIMHRDCKFHTMQFNQLIPAILDKKVDLAVSFITITPKRSELVKFSIPYLLSYSRFLSKHSTKEIKVPFSLKSLDNQKIGVVKGTIFAEQIHKMKITNPIIKNYQALEPLLEALSKKEVDFILVDNPTAIYWEANSSGKLSVVGAPYMYGYGVGIAVNPQDKNLLASINKALIDYNSSDDFKNNYDKYIPHL